MLLALAPAAEATNVRDTLVVGIQSTKTSVIRPLDPLERDILSVYNLVYESLVVIDDNYLPQPGLAESWEESGGGRTWTFHIRSGVTFSDGSPLTARDVVATAEYILARATDESSASPGYYSNLRFFCSKITASDESTVVVRAPAGRSYYGVLYAMTFPVLPAALVDTDNPPGTGPYVITSFTPSTYISLDANMSWWKSLPQVRSISFMLHDTQKAVIESYEYARVNTIFTRSIAAAQYKSGMNSLSLDYRTNQLEVLLLNQSYAKLKSEAVRKAIRYAVNVDYIAQNVYMGMVDRTDTPMIPGSWMYNDTLGSYFVNDVQAARQLLADDGWSDTNEDGVLDKFTEEGETLDLNLRLYVYEEPDNDVRIETANVIKQQLAEIGMNVEIITTTYLDIQEKLSAGSFHLALCSFAMDVCPDPGFLLMSGNTGNYGRYRSTAMTDLCKELRACVNQQDYRAKLMDIQRRFAEDCPFICMFYRSGAVLTRMMYTTARDVREGELLRGIETFRP